jgi:hypothetical protein
MNPDAFPTSERNATRPWIVPLLTVLIVGAAIAYYWIMRSYPFDVDSEHYIAIAEGRIAEVHKPFSTRLLHPLVVRVLAQVTGVSVDAAFFTTNVASLAVLVSVGLILVLGQIRSVGLAAAIILCPMVLIRFREIYMPDCMHAAIAAVFFLLLRRGAWWYAMPLLFFMQLTRESTVLLTFFVAIVVMYHRKWKLAGAAVLCTLLAIGVVGRYAGEGQGNVHGASNLVYFVGKVPLNLLPNVFGVRIWTNTHAKVSPKAFPNEPLVTFELPAWLPSGSMNQIGIYSFEPAIPLATARMLLTFLGIMPSLVLVVLGWRRWQLVRDDGLSPVGQLSLSYGLAAYLLSPALGTAVGRYIFYGWPMTWIAAPELLVRYFNTNKKLIGQLTWLQAIACWTPLLLGTRALGTLSQNLISVAVALPCHVIAIKLLNRNRIS